MIRLLILLFVAALAYLWFAEPAIELGPGVMAPDAPQQIRVDNPVPFANGDYRITPLAEFAITAKVLGKASYRLGREADLSPLDLALGWGPMSDEAVLGEIDIRQSNRWYRWHTHTMPIPRRKIETHSANMHMVPADQSVAEALHDVRRGQIVSLSGKLVRIDADDGWHWVSSLSREDTGGNACEVLYVEQVDSDI
jgi:hypothetical protein